ncbi:hypothetical protein GQ44DRAFT_767875 [Phaeosphaeriaceae sp. PMI808]|nr:hypothetical protein GQ44DRAFT_767875 [Phaeosphaeriaceae sp. PMI808]
MSLLNCLLLVSHSSRGNASRYKTESKAEHQKHEYTPNTSVQSTTQPTFSRLLSLPKELRLEIWRYGLTDPTKERLVLLVRRDLDNNTSGKRFSNSLYKHVNQPEIITSFLEHPSSAIGTNLLQVNRFIYAEALPILYHAVIFSTRDIDRILHIFIDQLSTFAKSHIRYVRLKIHGQWHNTDSVFYWVLTCAQVAKLNDSLRQVEVADWSRIEDRNAFKMGKILYPLLKIKAHKKLVDSDGSDADFQKELAEAKAELEAKADLRKAMTTADLEDSRTRAKIKSSREDYR